MALLRDAVSVVTGGASGIGRATALALAQAGSDVVVCDINASGAEQAATEIEQTGRRALAIEADVGRRDGVEELIERAVAWQGRCDLFISNAGVGCRGAAHEFSVEEWEEILDIDLWASIWAVRLLVPHMLERGSGHLAFVASGAGLEGLAAYAPYCVAKFGLIGLAESLARQLKGTGIGVSIIIPGAISTEGWRNFRIAGAEGMSSEEIGRLRTQARDGSAGWPAPEAMAAVILEGLRHDRLYILQKHPTQPDWFGDLLRRKAEDPDAFVLGES